MPKISTWRAGGLKGRGEDGDDASVVISDISDINSGVDGAQERRGDDRLDVLATLRIAGEPRDRLDSGIRDPSRGFPTGELLYKEGGGEEHAMLTLVRELGDEGDCGKNRLFISSIASAEGRPDEGLDLLISVVSTRSRMVVPSVVLRSPASGLLLCKNSVRGELLFESTLSKAEESDPIGENV